MSILGIRTDAIIKGAGDDICITSGTHPETKLHHGLIWCSHPKISDNERWIILLSDNRGFEDHKTACEKFKELLPKEYHYIKVMEEEKEK